MRQTIILLIATLFLPLVAIAAIPPGKTYDAAVSCKAVSLLAKNVSDDKSKLALKAIEMAIDAEIAHGKTRDQANADIEYSRFDIVDNGVPQSVIDEDWKICVTRWTTP